MIKPNLTVEERTILDRFGRGSTHKEIMRELDMAQTTFNVNLRVIKAKLSAGTVTHAVVIAIHERLIDPIGMSE